MNKKHGIVPYDCPVLVNLPYNTLLNIDGIIEIFSNKELLSDYVGLSNGRISGVSFGLKDSLTMAYPLMAIIEYGECVDGAWWKSVYKHENRQKCLDVVYYDEFVVLMEFGLIRLNSFEFLTMDQIVANVGRYDNDRNKQLEWRQDIPLLQINGKALII